jgi:prepilin-type N-terminal cleavage/methylation domain-containing protein
MKKNMSGFSLVELLVVIAVIGILSTISVLSFSRYQADGRDSQRAQRATVIAEALEKYFLKNGEYPNCASLTTNGTNVSSSVLPGIDTTVLVTPQATTGQTNSIICTDLSTTTGPDIFAYVGDGSPNCLGSGSCLQYTLKYIQESTGQVKSISSRHTGKIATSGTIADLSATPFSFSQVNLSWTATSGATSYNIQYATNPAFTGATAFTPSSTSSASVTGLSVGTLYYFQVQPVSTTGSAGNWSNTASATTYTLGTPTCTAALGPVPLSQLQCSWGAITNATSYTLEYATNSSFTSATTVTNATSPYVVTGLAAGTTLYFHVKAVASGYSSGWSTTASATTQLPAPVCSTSTVNSNTQVTITWAASAGAVTYTLEYANNSGFTGATSINAIATTTKSVTGLNNGTTYYFHVRAVNGAVVSTYGACPSATTGIDGPSSPGWTIYGDATRAYAGLPWMPGADPGYGSFWGTVGANITGTCSPGATVVTRLQSYYAHSDNSSQNGATLMDWTAGNQTRYVVDGNPSWYVWWNGWVACQVGTTRVGDTYLGNAGPY